MLKEDNDPPEASPHQLARSPSARWNAYAPTAIASISDQRCLTKRVARSLISVKSLPTRGQHSEFSGSALQTSGAARHRLMLPQSRTKAASTFEFCKRTV